MILETNEATASKIVDAIREDFRNRRGLGAFWDGVSDKIQGEILVEWRRITCVILDQQQKGRA